MPEMHSADTQRADRWPLIVALLAAPSRESRRLAALLTRWPTAEVRRHLLVDDVRRRLWTRGNAQTAREQEAVSG